MQIICIISLWSCKCDIIKYLQQCLLWEMDKINEELQMLIYREVSGISGVRKVGKTSEDKIMLRRHL